MTKFALWLVVVVVVGVLPTRAQQETRPDTVRLVRIGDSLRVLSDTTTIFHPGAVVVGTRAARNRFANTVQRIRLDAIERTDAASVSDVARLVPGAHVQTNSRGESLLYLRNSGERQLAVYFDGALLNVPWDNRVDLDLIPTAAIAGISVSKGAASAEFGANLMGGAVNLITRDLGAPGRFSEGSVHFGSGNERQVELTHLGRTSSFSILASVGLVQRDGLTVSSDAALPFSQDDGNLRTNTDLKRVNALVRGEYIFDSDVTVSLSGLVIDAEKGIAPEGHKDPAEGGVRFWRYPDWRNRILIATLGRPSSIDRPLSFQSSVWVNSFRQRVVAFDSEAYRYPTEDEDDDDFTFGGRFVLAGDFESVGVRFTVGATQARHDQVDTEFSPPDLHLPPLSGPKQRYRQLLANVGVETDYRSGAAVYSLGVNLDARSIQEADVFPEPDAQHELGFRAGLIYDLAGPFEFRAAAGRRSRFPTLREQFSGALGRFVVNPNLGSEEAWLSETAIRYGRGELTLEATAFITITSNTIDQDVTIVDGASKRIRVNLNGSRNVGIEVNGSVRPIEPLLLTADAVLSRLRAEDAATGSYDRRIAERPENRASVRARYTHGSGISGMAEVLHVGQAYSLDDDGEFVELAPSTVLNLRGAYRFVISGSRPLTAELFGRVNNVGDILVENQLGLPGPGRTVVGGFKLSV